MMNVVSTPPAFPTQVPVTVPIVHQLSRRFWYQLFQFGCQLRAGTSATATTACGQVRTVKGLAK